jgi:hypothetical protein
VVAQGFGGSQVGEEIPGGAEGGHPGPDALVVQAAKMRATDRRMVEILVILDKAC